jgi:hypothetical protein
MDNDFFCFVENEPKAFDIVKQYNLRAKACLTEMDKLRVFHQLDNEIQAKEIEAHLYINHIPEIDGPLEQVRWTSSYGHAFRIYLNTLKIIYISLIATGCCDIDTMTFEEFCKFKEAINKNKALLDIIHS